jgi:glycosyltransferase involved in cell wall biosynthesis
MTADTVGGVWVYASAMARGLCARGHRVTLATLGPPPRPDQLHGIADVAGLDLVATDLALEWMDPDGVDFTRALSRLPALERRTAPDVVHLNGFREACAAWRAPVLVAAHSCVNSWWQACRGDESSGPWRSYADRLRAGLAAADAWVAPSAAYRDQVDMLHAPPTRGRVIWNGLAPTGAAAPKNPIILAAGRVWDEAKNVAALVAIAPRLPWRVHIAGRRAADGSAPASSCGSCDVTWLGELPHSRLLSAMQRAAVFVAPALYEPFGLTVLEAASAGCALVLADIPSFRELWDGAALFADPRDRAMLQAALERVVRDEPLRLALQRSAAIRARRYSLDAMCGAYCGIYADMLRSRSPAATESARAPSEARP